MRRLGLYSVVFLVAVALGTPTLLPAQSLVCAAGVSPRPIRFDGMTELIGDVVLSCTGGTAPAIGSVIPTADITLTLNTNVTSRLLGTMGGTTASEALLLLDEPGSGQPPAVPGFGPAAPQILCSSPLGAVTGGCVEYARVVNGGTIPVAASSSSGAVTPGANVFQGVVNANQVTFHGVPLLAPATGYPRGIRITNVRANAAGLPSGNLSVPTLTASITTTGPVTMNVINPALTAGSVQPGLTASVRDATNSAALAGGGAAFTQCTGSTSPVPVAMLQFSENFGTAFVTRVAPTSAYTGQSGTPVQNLPGSIYNSESAFVFPAASSGGAVAGLADYGTRLKASFNNVPTGVRIFVSVTNLAANTFSSNTPAPSGASTSSYAALIQSESSADANGVAPFATATTTVNGSATGLVELIVVNGSATAVWEVINSSPNAFETLQFGVWQQFTSNGPPAGTATVNLGLAPTYTANTGSAASSSLPVGRFVDTSSPANLLSITSCQNSCTYTLTGNATYPVSASNGSVTVAASPTTCAWTASSPVNWIVITTGSSGTGNGTVQFTLTANPNSAPRNATLTIAGQSYMVTQAGTAKSASTTTLSASPASATPGQTVTVTATVTPSNATGTVTFSDANVAIGTVNVNNGIASLATAILTSGSHPLTAVYSGDNAFNTSTSTAVTVTVAAGKGTTTIGMAAFPNPASAGQAVTLSAIVFPSSATGTVTFKDVTVTLSTAPLTGGAASITISNLTSGSHTLTASYSGDFNNAASTSSAVSEVINAATNQSTVSLSVVPSPANVGQIVTLTATVTPANATGTVTFKDNGTALTTMTLAGGPVSFSTTALTSGTHTLTVSYSGDSNNGASTSSAATEVINPPTAATTTTLAASPNPATVGQAVTLTVTVKPISATGAVTFSDGPTTLNTVTLSNGAATFTTSTLAPGSHTLTAVYNGNAAYSSSSAAVTEVVNSPVVAVTLSPSPNPATFGQAVTLTVIVIPASATGTVSVLDSFTGSTLGPATLSGGNATITTSTLKVGSHSLQASYSGDSNNAAGNSAAVTETVNPAASSTTLLVAPASSSPGQTVVLTATVTPSGATGTVVFRDGLFTLGSPTLASGTATVSISTLAAGSHTLTASYSGDGNYAPSSSSSVFETVGPAPACASFPTGFVPFSSANNVSQPNAAGDLAIVGTMSSANFTTYQALSLPAGPNQQFCGTVLLAPGIPATAYVPTAAERTGNFSAFAGLLVDPQANGTPFPGGIIPSSRIPGTLAWRITALLQNSTTTLSVTPAVSAPGQPVTLTAAVTPSTTTGTVTFLEGSTTIGTATLIAGTATFTTSSLAAGSHVVTASYGGDSKIGASTSNQVTETVGLPATTTTLSVTPATSTSGQTVTLTATVSPASASGSVTFKDGSTILGTAAVNAGTATLTTTTLATGSHLLTASYSGDSMNGASASSPVTESVGLATPTTTLSVTPSSSTFGQAVTLTATVSPASATGSVTFLDGSAILQTVALNAGTAAFTTSTLATGSHLLTASYSGDSKNGANTSSPATETVTKSASTTGLTVSSASSSPGQAVTLTATVTPSSATGNVSFLDGQTSLGTATLSGGVATLTTSTLAAGSHALSASYGGDPRYGASISPTLLETVVSASPVQITSAAAPAMSFVNVAWSQTFKATGGTAPYKWTLPANSIPDLALTSSGDTAVAVVSGTPQTAGAYQLTVRVQDSGTQSATAPLSFTVYGLPVVTISATQPATPADQPAPQLSLAQSYPVDLNGTLTLAFAPNAPGLPAGYNDVQFSTGGVTFPFTIRSGATTPNPPIPPIQLGSVAGDIIGTLGTLNMLVGAQSVAVPGQSPTVKITVPALRPIIVPGSVRIINVTASGFQVSLDASSTTRDLSSGAFVFTAAPGTQMNGCSPSCTVSFGAEAAAWFASSAGVANGGTTSLAVPFAFSGDPSVIGTVSVTLTNSVGTSAPVSGGK